MMISGWIRRAALKLGTARLPNPDRIPRCRSGLPVVAQVAEFDEHCLQRMGLRFCQFLV